MTPAWAKDLLDRNTSNRVVNWGRVAGIAKDMENGTFLLTHQGIAVGSNGVLLDGQHRLLAILRSGKSVKMLLSENCDPQTFKVLDTGVKRTCGQVMQIKDVPNAHNTAATCRILMCYQSMPDLVWSGPAARYSNNDVYSWYEERALDVDEAVREGTANYKKFPLIKATSLSAFVYLARAAGWDFESVARFMTQLCVGVELEIDNPVFSLRRALINKSVELLSSHTAKSGQAMVASLIVVFNWWAEGKRVRLFRLPALLPMPKVVGR